MNEIKSENLKTVYHRICESHDNIADFRAKLLALLPIASGAGIFFLMGNRSLSEQAFSHLFPIGIFGALITLGLFFYELRGIQKCRGLINSARKLEKALLPDSLWRYGAFHSRQKAALGGLVGAVGAALIIYPAVIAAWIYLTTVGLFGSGTLKISAHWIFTVAFVMFLIFGLLINKRQKQIFKDSLQKIEGNEK